MSLLAFDFVSVECMQLSVVVFCSHSHVFICMLLFCFDFLFYQAYEVARLERIRRRQDECRRLNQTVECLLKQDAKRHGNQDMMNVEPMSRREASHAIHKVSRHLNQFGLQMKSDFSTS